MGGGRTDHRVLTMSWEGEIFGVGMLEAIAEGYPEHADGATACPTMEWFNIHRCEDVGDAAGVEVSLEQAEKLGREGAELVRKHETLGELTVAETPAADQTYKRLGRGADTSELKAFADDLYDHDNALRDWLKSERDGKSDGAEKVFAYLERNGLKREDAVLPRKVREDAGGEKHKLVLAFVDTEDAADQAAEALKDWDKVTEYMNVDAVGVLVLDDDGQIKEHGSSSAPASEGWRAWSRRFRRAAYPSSEVSSEAPPGAVQSASSSTRA